MILFSFAFFKLDNFPMTNFPGTSKGCWGNFQNIQPISPSTPGEESVISCSSLSIPKHHSTMCNETDYGISRSVNQLNAIDKLQPNLKHANTFQQHIGCVDYDGFSSEDMLPCTKRLKMENPMYTLHKNENFGLPDPLMVLPCPSERLPLLQRQPQSPISVDSEVLQKLSYESASTPMSLTNSQQPEEFDLTESISAGENVEIFPYNLGFSRVDHKDREVHIRTDFIQTEPELEAEGTKSGTPKTKGVSLTELFTADQIKENMPTLEIGQDSTLKLHSLTTPSTALSNSHHSEETDLTSLTDSINLCEHENFGLSDQLMAQSRPSEGPESPMSVNSEVLQKLNYESVTAPRAFSNSQQQERPYLTSLTDSTNTGDNVEVSSDIMGFNRVNHNHKYKEVQVRTGFTQIEPELEGEGTKPENAKTKAVSLIEILTADQIRQHISSLGISQVSTLKFPFSFISFVVFLN